MYEQAMNTTMDMSSTLQMTEMVSDVNRNIGDNKSDQSGLVDPVLGYPGEYSHGDPSKIVRANCR
jgi:hypothetical protein